MSEGSKVSSRKSGAKKGSQKYQNAFAYTHNRKSKLTKKIQEMPVDGLCARCTEQILWRKKYRKYKPLTTASKWQEPESQKNTNYGVVSNNINIEDLPEDEEHNLKQKLDGYKEREKRTILRKLNKGELDISEIPEKPGMYSSDEFSDSYDSEE
ncbi:hypothetical protein AX774_g838 [Zancudomyces culisetae]|uniref:Uncharacterized protein n=1 Tax=Zancudomyces culisetae TaxID=1213189 RepID=A0A1R1PXC8_ZANCU|nr:hypothetical protein AX774_g838 [Zancudomyces culisetae]|eukprot:OMH85604.1 hypothetical protein AX774_g838 [Zancudomyces culisetae]